MDEKERAAFESGARYILKTDCIRQILSSLEKTKPENLWLYFGRVETAREYYQEVKAISEKYPINHREEELASLGKELDGLSKKVEEATKQREQERDAHLQAKFTA